MSAPRKPADWPRKRPRIAHFTPYLFGDTLAAIWRAVALRFWFIDQNAHVDKQGEVWVLHWGDMRDFRWEWTGRYRKIGGRKVEVRRKVPKKSIHTMSTREVGARRSARFGGRRPRKAIEHMRVVAKAGIVWCMEAKDNPAFLNKKVWMRLAALASRTGAVVVVMTLTHLHRPGHPEDPYTRLALATDVGFAAAALPRTPKPRNWYTLSQRGVVAWGRWR